MNVAQDFKRNVKLKLGSLLRLKLKFPVKIAFTTNH